MSDIVERLRGRADRYRQLWGNAAYYTEGDALFDEKTADTITTLRATNERLRAALEEIEQVALSYVHMKYAKLARAALEEEKPNE